MRLLLLLLLHLIMAWPLMVMTSAQPPCDPLTQYEHNSRCCELCGPGTSMSSLGTCPEPRCLRCGRSEYQEEYTREPKCRRQPYCDPNRNFQVPVHESTERSRCVCKLGFHCSAEECTACVPHRACEPGLGAQSRGNHSHDTVCQKCPEGTYSEERSWDGVCQEWTECGEGQHVHQSGTDVSDNVCMETSRTRVVAIVVALLVVLPGLVAALMCWRCRGKRGEERGKVKGCVESCLAERRPRGANPADRAEEESGEVEALPAQEEGYTRTPAGNGDESSGGTTSTTGVLLSEWGNLVAQENGKADILSCQESRSLGDGQTAEILVL